MESGTIRTLVETCGERERATPGEYPAQNIQALFEAGCIAGPLAREHGGSGWTLRQTVEALELLASEAPSTALVASMPVGLAAIYGSDPAPLPPEHRAGWEEQRTWLGQEYAAHHLFAACNSERGAGGSLAATQTFARLDDGRFRLSGEKILASGGSYATWFFSTAKVAPDDLPDAGIVEFFFVPVNAPGVTVLDDWDGFGMRASESQSVRYDAAPAGAVMGFPNFIERAQPVQSFYCLFAAIPLGCARGMLRALGTPAPQTPALRQRLGDALMRYEALRAYLLETASGWRFAAGPTYAAQVLRTKSYVAQEATKLCAELFALSGGRHYRRGDRLAGLLADSFAGTALRPPLALAIESLVEGFSLDSLDAEG